VEIHVLQGERPMAADNKTLGRFQLTGIPPAPRGVPQIEVTFDIDVNGIVNVSAKDLGTGKAQSITITGSTGLSDAEIERMVKDAERHAEEDRKRKETVELRNQADSMIYQAEKTIKDLGDKADKAKVDEVNRATEQLKEALKGEDNERIKNAIEQLTKPLYELTAALYQQQADAGKAAGGTGGGAPAGENKENVVDAEYEVDEDKKKQ
jgi:molecular chaperone DnaK